MSISQHHRKVGPSLLMVKSALLYYFLLVLQSILHMDRMLHQWRKVFRIVLGTVDSDLRRTVRHTFAKLKFQIFDFAILNSEL
jgi:hypothetical protein